MTTKGDGSLLTEEFAKFAKETLKEWKVPGVSIAVIDGEHVFTQSYGVATYPDTAATSQTLWYGGSTTKAFVCAAIAHLIDTKTYPALEKGWATPISSIIRDDFVLKDAWATEHLTLEDAACHRTGFPRHDGSMFRFVDDEDGEVVGPDGKRKRYSTAKDLVRNLRNLEMTAEPRVKFQYCNFMYLALSLVVETVTGKPLGDVLRELIWEPLGMSSTYFALDAAQSAPEHLATGYCWDEDAEKYTEVPHMSVVELSGAGGIISTAADYAKWVKCLLHEAAPFSVAAHKEIRMPRIVAGMPEQGRDITMYGLGWQRALYRGHLMYTHGGGLEAFGAQVYWFPDAEFGVVAFANTSTTSNAAGDVLVYRLVHDKLGIAPEDQVDVGVKWHEMIEMLSKDYDKGVETIFPDKPEPPLPSPVSLKDLAGTYYDPGYKNITLRVETDPGTSDQEILVGDHHDSTWQISTRLYHVTGSWWILYADRAVKNCSKFSQEWQRIEFKIGPNGKPSALVVQQWDRIASMYQGAVDFTRIDS